MKTTYLIFALVLISFGWGNSINAAEGPSAVYTFCVADNASNCPGDSKNRFYGCGADTKKIAGDYCKVYGPDGEEIRGKFRLNWLSTTEGGQCGYTVLKVECL